MIERILCKGAPCGDFYHEAEEGFPIPNRMGLIDPVDASIRHWFEVLDGVTYYEYSEACD